MISDLFKQFLIGWGESQENLKLQYSAVKKHNRKLIEQYHVTTKDAFYRENKHSVAVSDDSNAAIILKEIPGQLYESSDVTEDQYKIEGSVGKGNVAEIPWICVFDREITTSAQSGYYIVYLFRRDLRGVYLSLNLGWTQYENEYGKNAQKEIKRAVGRRQKQLRGIDGFNFSEIDLSGEGDLAKGYELGSICSKYYDLNDFPSSEDVVDDLNSLLEIYQRLKAKVVQDLFHKEIELKEEDFQKQAQKGRVIKLKKGPVERKPLKPGSKSEGWQRNRNIAYTALVNANFKCENDTSHQTFIWAKMGQQFVEAHHLVPMEFQGHIKVSIDVPENIISLCPNCHKAFHYASLETKRNLIRKFHEQRKDSLIERGIGVDEKELIKWYKADG